MTDGLNQAAGPPAEPLTRRERQVLALLAEGYSAPEIAEKLTVAVSSVKTHVQHLYAKLGVNGKRQAISRARELGLLGAPQAAAARASPTPPEPAASLPAPGPAVPKPSLPVQVTRFFGHEADIAQVRTMLADWRLVTLTGPGGVGKTRLSLRVAEELAADLLGGVYFIELAPISEPARVGLEIAAALGVPEGAGQPLIDRMAAFLAERQALLVLDNCEHLLAACAWLADNLLRASPRLRIMATSREVLGIAGEAVFVVPSLPFPDPGRLPELALLDDYTALSLFADRARAVQPGFALTPQNARGVARICQRLDGIPLALELAAARVRLLDVDSLADRLEDAFKLLTTGSRTALPRHQTLRAAIDWSYQLLSEPERLLLRRLSVFAGGCTLEAAEAVCADGLGAEAARPRPAALLAAAEVFDRLATLVDKSMVVASQPPGQATRYHQLEMVRQYASEKLEASGETARLRQRHLEYFQALAQANGRALLGKEWPEISGRFDAEIDNLRLALAWAFRDPDDALPGITLAVAFQPIWFLWDRGEIQPWLVKGVEWLDSGAQIEPLLKARFLAWASTIFWGWPLSPRLAEQSLAISRGLGPEYAEVLCWSLWVMAVGGSYLELLPEHWDEAEALLDEQAAIIPRLGPDTFMEPWLYEGYNLWLRAVLANYRGQLERAREFGRESLRLFDACGNDTHRVSPLIALGDTALRLGDHDQAQRYFEDAWRLSGKTEDVRHSDTQVLLCETAFRRGDLAAAYQHCLDYLKYSGEIWFTERVEMAARILARAGRFPEAARLSGAAEAWSEKWERPTSTKVWGRDSYWGDPRTRFADVTLDALAPDWRDRPDADALVQAWNEGRAMTIRQVKDFALGLTL